MGDPWRSERRSESGDPSGDPAVAIRAAIRGDPVLWDKRTTKIFRKHLDYFHLITFAGKHRFVLQEIVLETRESRAPKAKKDVNEIK